MASAPSVAQLNAAFDAIYPEIEALITQHIPPFAQSMALNELHSTEGRAGIVKLINDALVAAEAVT